MKQLLLMRHAKSSWDDALLSDFDRPLARRGRDAAPRMACELVRRGWQPEFALVSPAARSRETWELSVAEFAAKPAKSFPVALYDASAPTLLGEVRQTPESVRVLLVIGHNPGLEDFARLLASDSSEARALKQLGAKFPTAALAHFTLNGGWADLETGAARLRHFLRPKDVG
jgi:phosphohistidine phosphatase